jgi:hypothetical protein
MVLLAPNGPPAMSAVWSLTGESGRRPDGPLWSRLTRFRHQAQAELRVFTLLEQRLPLLPVASLILSTVKLSHLSRQGGQEHANFEPVYAGRRASDRLL